MKKLKTFAFGLLALGLFTGCAQKNNISNQTAFFWHNSIYKNVTQRNLDLADDRFTSLELEHPNSQYIPINLLILSKAHFNNGEYQLAEFYMNEYEKRYANKYNREWAEYQKAKIKFFSLQNAYTNQKKVQDTLTFINNLLNRYPDSIYNYELNTMKIKLEDTQIIFDNKIAKLYKKLDKPKAAKFYERKSNDKIIPPHIPWYKNMFYW